VKSGVRIGPFYNMSRERLFPALLFWLWASLVSAQMVDPAIDHPGEPSSYFSQPTDEIGVMDGRAGTTVTPEGYLFTGYGELMFFVGNPPQPASQRIRTLYHGYLPEIEYTYHDGPIEYRMAAFAATLDGDPESPMMNFVRVVAVNTGRTPAAGHFGAAIRYVNEDYTSRGQGYHRFRRLMHRKQILIRA